MLEAVLFDLDGTLVDSVPLWREALTALVVARQGHPVAGAIDGLLGTSAAEAVATVGRRLGWPAAAATADARWVAARVRDRHRAGVVWRDGALRLIAEVRASAALTGLVTSSTREMVEAVLADRRCPAFDVVVTSDEVPVVKPAPDPYLAAANSLGCAPARCVAVEDSTVGVASALAAGCAVIAVGPAAAGADLPRVRRVDALTDVRFDPLARLLTEQTMAPTATLG